MRFRHALALAATGAILASRLWFAAHRAIDLDEFEHVHAAWAVAQAQVPYVNFFEHHTPALYLLGAPLFAGRVATDARTAVRALVTARFVMWAIAALSVAITYLMARRWRGPSVGAAAALLLVTSPQFLESMLEFRPDVPAVCALLLAVFAGPGFLGGLAVGTALMFTQKVIFAAPGFVVAIAVSPRAIRRGLAFAAGVLIPIGVTTAWFAARHAVGPLVHFNGIVNLQLNADRMASFPRLASSVIQQPALYGLGLAGLVVACRHAARDREQVTLTAVAVALLAGIFVIGRAYDQYYALLLPLLAIVGAAFALRLRAVQRPVVAAGAAVAIVGLLCFNLARTYRSNAVQIEAIAWVTEHTAASDSYLGGSPGPALFRPHAWFYFFLTGPFATDAEFARLLDDLAAGRVQPQIVIDDRLLARAPAPLLAYLRAHYRRQKEYGSEGLKIRAASDRFDRPLTR